MITDKKAGAFGGNSYLMVFVASSVIAVYPAFITVRNITTVNGLQGKTNGLVLSLYVYLILGLLTVALATVGWALAKAAVKKDGVERVSVQFCLSTLVFLYLGGWLEMAVFRGMPLFSLTGVLRNLGVVVASAAAGYVLVRVFDIAVLRNMWQKRAGTLGLVHIALFFLAVFITTPGGSSTHDETAICNTGIPDGYDTGLKVLMINYDGLDWSIVSDLIEKGRLPNIANLVESGAAGPMVTERPILSPIIWTTIATGMPPDKHGIKDFFFWRIPGIDYRFHQFGSVIQRTPGFNTVFFGFIMDRFDKLGLIELVEYNQMMRREPALWNILTQADRSSATIQWRLSYPPQKVKGMMVSLIESDSDIYESESAGNLILDNMSYPPDVYEKFAAARIDYDEIDPAVVEKLDCGKSLEFYKRDRDIISALEMYDLVSQPYDLFSVYLIGLDWTSHICHYDYSYIDFYYDLADKMVGRILDLADESTVVMLLSDHGFDYDIGFHSPDATLIINGPVINSGVSFEDGTVSIYDIAPTVLYLTGLPAAKGMPGRVVSEAVSKDFTAEFQNRIIDCYPYDRQMFHTGSYEVNERLEESRKKHLKNLGYLK